MYYKTIFHTILFVLFLGKINANQSIDSLWVQANKAYEQAYYQEAVTYYENLIDSNWQSENLYFNLANAYFKTGQKGKSIVYYEKLLQLNPNHSNAKQNLAYVNQHLENQIEKLPDLFFVQWAKSIVHWLSSNTWAYFCIAFGWLALFAFGFYLFAPSVGKKKIAFTAFLSLALFGFCSFIFAEIVAEKIFKTQYIVLIKENTYSKTAPSLQSQDAVQLFEGEKLKVSDQTEDFYKVKLDNGSKVWVQKTAFWEV